jgi:hypothetical protein
MITAMWIYLLFRPAIRLLASDRVLKKAHETWADEDERTFERVIYAVQLGMLAYLWSVSR